MLTCVANKPVECRSILLQSLYVCQSRGTRGRISVWVRIDAWRFGLRREGLCPPRRFGTSRGSAIGVSVGAGASLAKRCRAALATAVHRGRRSILANPIPHQVSIGKYFSEFAPIQRCARRQPESLGCETEIFCWWKMKRSDRVEYLEGRT